MDLFAETIEKVAPPPNGLPLSTAILPQLMQQKVEEDELAHKVFEQIQGPAEHERTSTDHSAPGGRRREAYEEECKKYEEESKESTKCALKSVLAHRHPDILYADFEKKMKKLEERVVLPQEQCDENQCKDGSEDSDTDSDEEIRVPNKKHWLDICMGIWGMEDAAAVISQVKATKQGFKIYTDCFYNDDGDSCCAAILHDFPHRPIAAWSKVIPRENCVSPFYLHIYGAVPFYIYCPSESVRMFVMQNWHNIDKCGCSGTWETVALCCKACSQRLMFTGDHKDHEVAYELSKLIFSDISELQKCGLPWFSLRNGGTEKNEAAYHVASLKEDKEYKLKEIGKSTKLWDIIYREAFGIFFE
ncbi:hypothetical protein MKW92_026700 [Papaver armeniacum]|nr:hypothetical protein MKW92_026700 [Papaver armeniacum]